VRGVHRQPEVGGDSGALRHQASRSAIMLSLSLLHLKGPGEARVEYILQFAGETMVLYYEGRVTGEEVVTAASLPLRTLFF
jgi:hypothetical protein